ncbi:hypothetical protein RFI_25876, partial [Reticulomyxa filosa]
NIGKAVGGNSNVICSGSDDSTIRFWDIRSNKKELYVIKGDDEEEDGIRCIRFVSLNKKVNDIEQKSKDDYGVHLYYDIDKVCFDFNFLKLFILKFGILFDLFFFFPMKK